jgi:hypothetical protein
MTRVRFFGMLMLMVVSGCGQVAQEPYFPLTDNARWDYRVVTMRPTGDTVSTQTMRVDGSVTIAQTKAAVRRSDTGHQYAIAVTDAGVQRLGVRRDVDEDFARETEPRFVLKKPYVVGTTWQAQTVPYLLLRRAEFPPEVGLSHSAAMVYTIETVGEKVTVPAGAFDNCLRVKGIAQVRLYADPVAGFADVPLVTTEWYCPSVGLAKLERDEIVTSPFISGGRIYMELTAFQR